MSQRLISHNPDLKQLRDEGFNVQVVDGYLIVRDVPYVVAGPTVKRDGIIATKLQLAGDDVVLPVTDHVAFFIGEPPCDKSGSPHPLINSGSPHRINDQLTASCSFSAKPKPGPYATYYHKLLTYVGLIAAPAESLEPAATAHTFPLIEDDDEESVFEYLDTASSRAGIVASTEKLKGLKIAIVGLGGTGSYILDLISKTPVAEIHIWDGDRFENHSAFRAPGAATKEELTNRPYKVDYYAERYKHMRRGIVPHPEYVGAERVSLLTEVDFVFIAVDNNEARGLLVKELSTTDVAFVDTGMGIDDRHGSLGGMARVTTSTPDNRQLMEKKAPTQELGVDEVYTTNIQVADMNALAGALAVIRFKKWCGFYQDLEAEHNTLYTIDGNTLSNQGAVR